MRGQGGAVRVCAHSSEQYPHVPRGGARVRTGERSCGVREQGRHGHKQPRVHDAHTVQGTRKGEKGLLLLLLLLLLLFVVLPSSLLCEVLFAAIHIALTLSVHLSLHLSLSLSLSRSLSRTLSLCCKVVPEEFEAAPPERTSDRVCTPSLQVRRPY